MHYFGQVDLRTNAGQTCKYASVWVHPLEICTWKCQQAQDVYSLGWVLSDRIFFCVIFFLFGLHVRSFPRGAIVFSVANPFFFWAFTCLTPPVFHNLCLHTRNRTNTHTHTRCHAQFCRGLCWTQHCHTNFWHDNVTQGIVAHTEFCHEPEEHNIFWAPTRRTMLKEKHQTITITQF